MKPTYPRGVTACDLGSLLPGELTGALRAGLSAFERKLRGYTAPEAVLTGLETRTSSPVRLPARIKTAETPMCRAFGPCGEGPGYAGGIMSRQWTACGPPRAWRKFFSRTLNGRREPDGKIEYPPYRRNL